MAASRTPLVLRAGLLITTALAIVTLFSETVVSAETETYERWRHPCCTSPTCSETHCSSGGEELCSPTYTCDNPTCCEP